MDVHEIEAAGKGLEAYLEEFSDCFGRCDTASYLGVYVEGQHSELQRKSAEPIALKAEIVPRSLQVFLRTARWDEERMVDRVQEIVARDHGHPFAIGLVDESGSPKKGNHTAGVQRTQQSPRQYCGNTGKIDNCVVSVHIGYTAGSFIPCWIASCFSRRLGRTIRHDAKKSGFRTTFSIGPNPRSRWRRSNAPWATASA